VSSAWPGQLGHTPHPRETYVKLDKGDRREITIGQLDSKEEVEATSLWAHWKPMIHPGQIHGRAGI
jgi:hypothetical protein